VVGTAVAGAFPTGNPTGNARDRLVYAMKVTNKMTMAEYDERFRDRVDAIYDLHTAEEYETDLSGKYALLSEHFFYFGDNAPLLPEHLRGLTKRGPGHRSVSNAPYVEPFVRWIENTYEANRLHGRPRHGAALIPMRTLRRAT
jgi:putative DNA base modification enzyme with NMAD domain